MAAGSFQDPQVSYDLSEAFPKTNAPEVNSQGSGIKEPCKVKDGEGMPDLGYRETLWDLPHLYSLQ